MNSKSTYTLSIILDGVNMAEFDKIADTYDLMVNWPARLSREIPFFEKIIKDNQIKSILDIGCATGNHAREFTLSGVNVTAIDPSEEMLRIAASLTNGDNPVYAYGGLGISLPDGTFNMITILGNTATLSPSIDDFTDSIHQLYGKLTDHGTIVIQIVNYDKIIKNEILTLPAIKKTRNKTDYIFLREYRMVEGYPELTVITVEINGDDIKHRIEHTRHIPLSSIKLGEILSGAGFKNIKLYADYNYNIFNADISGSLIAVAEK